MKSQAGLINNSAGVKAEKLTNNFKSISFGIKFSIIDNNLDVENVLSFLLLLYNLG